MLQQKIFSQKLTRGKFFKIAFVASINAVIALCITYFFGCSDDNHSKTPIISNNPADNEATTGNNDNPQVSYTEKQMIEEYIESYPETISFGTADNHIGIYQYNTYWQTYVEGNSTLSQTDRNKLLNIDCDYLSHAIEEISQHQLYTGNEQFAWYHQRNMITPYRDILANTIPQQNHIYEESKFLPPLYRQVKTGLGIVHVPYKLQDSLKGIFLHYINMDSLSEYNFPAYVNLEDYIPEQYGLLIKRKQFFDFFIKDNLWSKIFNPKNYIG